MICYPFIVDMNGERFMFYNGNGRGVPASVMRCWSANVIAA